MPLTAPEVQRLLAMLLGDRAQVAFHLHRWRRQRRADARRSHYKRRLTRFELDVPL